MKPIDYVLAEPWAMTRPALDVLVSIVERANLDPSVVETQLGKPLDNSETATVRDGVAVIPVIGPICRYMNIFSRISGGTSIEILARDFQAALDNPKVKAIVLNIDSPGGTVNGTSEFAAQVFASREAKKTVAYIGNNGCSGAIWIAAACCQVVANDTAHLGSIGVVGDYPSKAKGGSYKEFVSSRAKNKRPDISTEEGHAIVQAHMDDLEDVFVASIAKYRGVAEEKVIADFGQGDHMIASKAVAAGMADGIGSLEGCIASLAKGEMPCMPAKKEPTKPPARKADSPPRRPAMSEQDDAPVAGDTTTISASELAELRRRAAEGDADKVRAKAAIQEAIDARADAFVAEFAGAANKTMYALGLRETFVLAATDDAQHPIGGSKTHRQDKLRETIKAKPAPTKEVASGDLKGKTRALGMDPADEPGDLDPKAQKEAAELEELDEATRKVAESFNGKK